MIVPSGPNPCPTTLIAMVAMPREARIEATTSGLLFLLSPKPCPKIATGQPLAGFVPEGTNRLKWTMLLPNVSGVPVRVPLGGMNCIAFR